MHKSIKHLSREKDQRQNKMRPDKRQQSYRGSTQINTVNKNLNKTSKPHKKIDLHHAPLRKFAKVPEGLSSSKEKIFKSNLSKMRDNVRKMQERAVIPKKPFRRLVREIANDVGTQNMRWQEEALDALQYSAEDYMTGLFEDAYYCAQHCKRVTLMAKDLALARRIRGVLDPGNR